MDALQRFGHADIDDAGAPEDIAAAADAAREAAAASGDDMLITALAGGGLVGSSSSGEDTSTTEAASDAAFDLSDSDGGGFSGGDRAWQRGLIDVAFPGELHPVSSS